MLTSCVKCCLARSINANLIFASGGYFVFPYVGLIILVSMRYSLSLVGFVKSRAAVDTPTLMLLSVSVHSEARGSGNLPSADYRVPDEGRM